MRPSSAAAMPSYQHVLCIVGVRSERHRDNPGGRTRRGQLHEQSYISDTQPHPTRFCRLGAGRENNSQPAWPMCKPRTERGADLWDVAEQEQTIRRHPSRLRFFLARHLHLAGYTQSSWTS